MGAAGGALELNGSPLRRDDLLSALAREPERPLELVVEDDVQHGALAQLIAEVSAAGRERVTLRVSRHASGAARPALSD